MKSEFDLITSCIWALASALWSRSFGYEQFQFEDLCITCTTPAWCFQVRQTLRILLPRQYSWESPDSNLRTSSTLNRIRILTLNIAVIAQMQLLGCNGKAQRKGHSSKVGEFASKINAMHLLFAQFVPLQQQQLLLLQRRKIFLSCNPSPESLWPPHTPTLTWVRVIVQTRTSTWSACFHRLKLPSFSCFTANMEVNQYYVSITIA